MNIFKGFKLSLLGLMLTLLVVPNLFAQKANFELAERFTTQMMDKMVGSTGVFPIWIEDTDQFWYTYQNSEGRNWYFVDAAKGSKRLLFDQEEMASKLSETFSRTFNAEDLELNDFTYDTDKKLFTFNVDDYEFTYNLNGNQLVKGDSVSEDEPERWANYSPDSTWIVFARTHNLYVMKADDPDSVEHQLTDDGELWNSYQARDGDTTSTERLRARANWFRRFKEAMG